MLGVPLSGMVTPSRHHPLRTGKSLLASPLTPGLDSDGLVAKIPPTVAIPGLGDVSLGTVTAPGCRNPGEVSGGGVQEHGRGVRWRGAGTRERCQVKGCKFTGEAEAGRNINIRFAASSLQRSLNTPIMLQISLQW